MVNVAILGATGTVGQKFISLLEAHPQFRVTELVASARSAGKTYEEVCAWKQESAIPKDVSRIMVQNSTAKLRSPILFSGLDSDVAYEIEKHYAEQGHIVITNARNHRMEAQVPLVIPEINHEHLFAIQAQNYKGAIVSNPNCSTTAIAVALAPLHKKFGISELLVHTMQAISGAGYPGIPSLDILGNVVPYIAGEEEKVETELLKILGTYHEEKGFVFADFPISAHCNRVPVLDGHTACVSLSFEKKPTREELIETWNSFAAFPQEEQLFFATPQPTIYKEGVDRPQPRLDCMIGKGMSVSLGRLRPCALFDYKFVLTGHNTIRGAAGAAILNAESLIALDLYKNHVS